MTKLWLGLLPLTLAVGCGDDGYPVPPAPGSGGTSSPGTGGLSSLGGQNATTGGVVQSTGGASGASTSGGTPNTTGGLSGTGGTPATTGGVSSSGSGGAVSTGGSVAATGGIPSSGGATGGSNNGGRSGGSGGKATGGAIATGGATATGGAKSTGGSSTGGSTGGTKSTGGSSTGGSTGGTKSTGGTTATGGATSTGGATGVCPATWSPPSSLVADLDALWPHMLQVNPPANFKNFIYDQIVAAGGKLNYCVRIDLHSHPSTAAPAAVTTAQRDQVQAMLEKQINNWAETWLKGYDCWPYAHIPVKVTGWAVADRAQLGWTDTSVPVYVNQLDGGGVPQCDEKCGRFFVYHNGSPSNYSGCAAGADNHYDMSLWLDNGLGNAGAGGDWGQRVDYSLTMNSLANASLHIVEHEMGHGFGLLDFYDWSPPNTKNFIMNAGSSTVVTEFDGWMLRQLWFNTIRARYY